jgi:hypothetical protein
MYLFRYFHVVCIRLEGTGRMRALCDRFPSIAHTDCFYDPMIISSRARGSVLVVKDSNGGPRSRYEEDRS